MTAKLPASVKARILSFPEYKMGAHKVALVMKDGSIVDDVIVAWGDEVVRVGGVDGCPINLVDVADAEDRS
jgi:hypothetical protein